jgi:hypothetical protein
MEEEGDDDDDDDDGEEEEERRHRIRRRVSVQPEGLGSLLVNLSQPSHGSPNPTETVVGTCEL